MPRSLRVLLFAHHDAGAPLFHGLRQAGHEILACFTHPGAASEAPSLADLCTAAGVPAYLHAAETAQADWFHGDARPDLIVCAGYRYRVSLAFLALPRSGAINLHLGPLPQYRGATPIPWGILNHESSWAITVHAMTHNYNDGGIVRKQTVALHEDDNAYDLYLRSCQMGAIAMVEAVNSIAAGHGEVTPQDLRRVGFFEPGAPFGGRIDWNQSAVDLAAFVRAMDFGRGSAELAYEHLAPPAQATLAGKEVGIWRARAGGTASSYAPGTITRCDDEVWVQTGRGHLVLERLRDPAGRDFAAAEYLAAHGIGAGESFDVRHAWRTNESSKLGHAA